MATAATNQTTGQSVTEEVQVGLLDQQGAYNRTADQNAANKAGQTNRNTTYDENMARKYGKDPSGEYGEYGHLTPQEQVAEGMDIGDMPNPDIPDQDRGGAPQAGEVDYDRGVYGGDQGIFDDVKQDVSDINPYTREVQDEELVSHQMDKLLNSDSKYMQDARRQGLEQANAMGGLGGTAGIGASMTAALRAGLPIAQGDAEAFRQAASENHAALNQFAQLSLQRATQLELGHLDARVRQDITKMANSMQMAVSKLQSDTQIEVANLDAATKVRLQEMNGALQERLAGLQFKYNSMLNDQQNAAQMALTDMQGQWNLLNTQTQGEYDLAGKQIAGEYNLEGYAMQQELQEETNYVNMVADANNTYWNMLTMYEGQELDDAARTRIQQQAERYYQGQVKLINKMFPDQDPISLTPGSKP